jgi:hypothetical protein
LGKIAENCDHSIDPWATFFYKKEKQGSTTRRVGIVVGVYALETEDRGFEHTPS